VSTAERSAQPASIKVLVVDDDHAMATTIVEVLESNGLTAAAAVTAEAALARHRELWPDVVICDQMLPDMSGLELCAAIRVDDPDVWLLLHTGHASLDSAIAAVGLIDQYLTKPAAPNELIKAVRLGSRRASARRAEREAAVHAAIRHRQALQINDSIVQHLVVAQARLEVGDTGAAGAAIEEGLVRARGLIDELLDPPREPEHVPAPPPAAKPIARSTYSVVIVDDSPDIRDLVRMLLEFDDGFTVVGEASDGREAIRVAEAQQPDVVLLDHSMPDMDGLSALPHLTGVSPTTTVVMLSGFSADRLEGAALERGAAAYLTKANLASDLVPELRRILAGGPAASSTA